MASVSMQVVLHYNLEAGTDNLSFCFAMVFTADDNRCLVGVGRPYKNLSYARRQES